MTKCVKKKPHSIVVIARQTAGLKLHHHDGRLHSVHTYFPLISQKQYHFCYVRVVGYNTLCDKL